MNPISPGDVTQILNDPRLDAGERVARILPLVYDELQRIARRHMRGERPEHTLHATALVNEAYLRLVQQPVANWHGRRYFLAAATEAMRRILVEHARSRARLKRGGGFARVDLDTLVELHEGEEGKFSDFVALDEALRRMSYQDPRVAEVVQLRFFAGLTSAETAQVLGVSERTVKNDWTFARAWLARELGGR